MAGIGFELRRMIDERKGFVAKTRAYLCAGLISSGPWLMTILTLSLLNLTAPLLGAKGGFPMFRALVTYCFAFSLILQGIGQMAITRWIADLLYSHKYQKVLPAFAATLLVTGLVHGGIGALFCSLGGFGVSLGALSVSLFTILGMTWIALTWLSVAREYDEVLRAYIYGTLLAVVGMVFVGLRGDTVGMLSAYTVGQAYTLAHLCRVIVRGMETGGERDFTVFRSLRKFPRLVLLGLAYNTAIWVDKMVFWYSDGVGEHPWVQYHPIYDTCSFLAYLTVVPALAVNLIRLETSFYEYYRAYYGAILGGMPLRIIEDRRRRMFGNLQESTIRLLRVQGAITIAVIIFAPFIIEFLELPPVAKRIFRLTAAGAFFHVMLLLTMLMQLYFDLRKQALATAVVFFALNGGLAWWSVDRGVETYGIGYAVASFLTLLLGYTLLHRSLEHLDHLTFTSQEIGDQPDDAKTMAEKTPDDAAKSETPAPAEATVAAVEEESVYPLHVEIPEGADELPDEGPVAAGPDGEWVIPGAPAESDETATEVEPLPAEEPETLAEPAAIEVPLPELAVERTDPEATSTEAGFLEPSLPRDPEATATEAGHIEEPVRERTDPEATATEAGYLEEPDANATATEAGYVNEPIREDPDRDETDSNATATEAGYAQEPESPVPEEPPERVILFPGQTDTEETSTEAGCVVEDTGDKIVVYPRGLSPEIRTARRAGRTARAGAGGSLHGRRDRHRRRRPWRRSTERLRSKARSRIRAGTSNGREQPGQSRREFRCPSPAGQRQAAPPGCWAPRPRAWPLGSTHAGIVHPNRHDWFSIWERRPPSR
ncbi:MAG: exopolysaccharide Pel transporter PelG [Planctomycetota bacterium]|jgi:uncharacterized membrane protein